MTEIQVDIKQVDQIYLKVRRIQGWLWPHACRLFAILDACQKQQGVTGNLFEIGVWHGKSAVVLASMLADHESLGVCDIFDDVGSNGESTKFQRFRVNVKRFFGDATFLRVYAKSSRELSSDEMSTNCRLIHIDGGHDSYNVYEDLMLAESCLHEKGTIIMDDAYGSRWPGVTDGIYRFLYHCPDRLVPLVYGFNKLVLVRHSAVAGYTEYLADCNVLKERFAGSGPFCYKIEEIMDHPIHIYFPRPAVQAAFCPGLATETFKRFPWLWNPLTRWLNQRLRKLRGQ